MEEKQTKRSRRAQRRQQQPAAEERPSDAGAEASENGPDAATGADASSTEAIRVENRKARRAAAAKRRARRERARQGSANPGLDAGEMVDDALARGTDRALKWLRAHFNLLQWAIVAGIAAWIGYHIHAWREGKAAAAVSDALMAAVHAEQARIGAPEDEGRRDAEGSLDPRRIFRSEAERLEAAAEAYRTAEELRPGSDAATLARLGLAGVLYEEGKYAEAVKEYEAVKASRLAERDPDVKGRAMEGMGLGLEAKEDRKGALKAFQELENTELPGFVELARYHQARLHRAEGDTEKAKELLQKVLEKTAEKKPEDGFAYVTEAARELLQQIDPSAAATPELSAEETLQRALEQLQQGLPEGVKGKVRGEPPPSPNVPSPEP